MRDDAVRNYITDVGPLFVGSLGDFKICGLKHGNIEHQDRQALELHGLARQGEAAAFGYRLIIYGSHCQIVKIVLARSERRFQQAPVKTRQR